MRLLLALAFVLSSSLSAAPLGDPPIGKAAPALKGTGIDGKPVDLSQYKGKPVVIEWINRGCPFVKKHYGGGNMQGLQKKYAEKGVAWLGVVSSAEGKEGHFKDAAQAQAWIKETGASFNAMLLDTEGTLGKRYGAKATPHMYVVDAKGRLAYKGAIDDKPSTKAEDIPGSKNYVAEALDALLAGKKPAVTQTKAYGCSVKYKN